MAPNDCLTGAINTRCKCGNNSTCICSNGAWYYESYPTESEIQEIVIPAVKIEHKFARTVKVNFNNRWDVLINNRNKMLKSVRKGNR